MDFPQAPPAPALGPRGRLSAGVGVLALAVYALVLAKNVGAVAAGSDSSGYMNHARLLASGSVHVQPRTIEGLPQSDAAPLLYVPLGFKPAPNGMGLVPTYPTGFALFVLAFSPLAGWRHAGDLTIILHSLAGLLATFALGRMVGLGRAWASLGAAIVGASPLYLFMSVQAMSDVPSLAGTTAAVIAAARSRERPAWALAAGAAIAVDVLLRPTNVLAFFPLGIALGASPRRWLLFLAGGFPGALFFCAHSLAAYGSLATTGYGDSSYAFSIGNVPGTLLHYARWLPALFTPLMALCLGLPAIRSVSTRTRMIFGTWILAYAAFFSTYGNTQEAWWYLRFLLPAAPAIVVGSLLVLVDISSRPPVSAWLGGTRGALVIAVAVAAVGDSLLDHSLQPLAIGKRELRYEALADWMKKNVPKDAVCLTMQASGTLFYYTDLTFVRWDAIDAGNVREVESAIRASGRPLYAVLFPFEMNESHVLEKRMPGRWAPAGSVEDIVIMRREFDAIKSK